MRLVLVTRRGCHLCDQALDLLRDMGREPELADVDADDELYRELETRRQIVLRYSEPVNGSRNDVAGVVNGQGNVMGLMPHPEHAVDPLLGSADGALILSSLVESARAHAIALV